MRRQLLPALLAFVAFTVILGILYPLAITGHRAARVLGEANGSLVKRDGIVVGSSLIGQTLHCSEVLPPAALRGGRRLRRDVERRLEPRPLESAARQRRRAPGSLAYRHENGLAPGAPVPVEAVTVVRIGPRPAHLPCRRPDPGRPRRPGTRPAARRRPRSREEHTDGRSLGFLGEPGVNVLELNLALDAAEIGHSSRMARGTLRIYLGAAPGVGKTFAMLGRGPPPRERGTDVVVGFVETHGRPKTAAQLGDLEVMPRRAIEYRGTTFEEMDVDAIIARRPEVALVDELAHTNVPGSRHEKRWEDVEALLDAGITVISTLNVQHLESVNDVVEQITGIKQQETIPDAVVRRADQIELVDMAPEAIRRRMAHGNIYPAERIDAALGNYFRTGNLGALRELALLWVADRVDDALLDYRERHGIDRPWETRERVVVALTGSADGERLVRRAARMAARSKGDLFAVHVRPQDGLAGGAADRLDRQRELVEELGGTYREVVGADSARRSSRRPHAQRDPDRARRDPPLAVRRADARLGDQPGDPRFRRRPRRPRDQPRRRRRARDDVTDAPPRRPAPAPVSSGSSSRRSASRC